MFAACVAMSLAAGQGMRANDWATGDEPHYLINARSLVVDGDLDVENNYLEKQGRAWGFLGPDMMASYALDGRLRPNHPPGTTFLVAPFYALGGHRGVYLLYHLILGLTGLGLWRLFRAEGLSPGRAALAALALAGATPLLFMSGRVFPDSPAALLILWLAWRWRRVDHSAWAAAALSGLLCAGLAWFHPRYWPVAAGALILCLGRTGAGPRPGWRAAWAGLAAAGLGGLGYVAYYWILFGRADAVVRVAGGGFGLPE